MVNEVEVENVKAEPGKEYVFTVVNEINDVNLTQDGCVAREDGLMMIDSGAFVNVCPKWFWELQSWNSLMVRLVSEVPTENRSRNTEKRQIWSQNSRSDDAV